MQTREYVEYLLKNYHGIKRDIEQMKLDLEYFSVESERETIEGMAMAAPKNDGTAPSNTTPGDMTGRIAILYREANRRINTTTKEELEAILRTSEMELKKLNLALDTLEERIRYVVRDLYINRLSWSQVCNKYYISPNTLNRYRKSGIEEIARSYDKSKLYLQG